MTADSEEEEPEGGRVNGEGSNDDEGSVGMVEGESGSGEKGGEGGSGNDECGWW